MKHLLLSFYLLVAGCPEPGGAETLDSSTGSPDATLDATGGDSVEPDQQQLPDTPQGDATVADPGGPFDATVADPGGPADVSTSDGAAGDVSISDGTTGETEATDVAGSETLPDVESPDTPGPDNGAGGPPDPSSPGSSAWTESADQIAVGGGLFGDSVGLVIYEPTAPGPHPVVVLCHGFQLGPGNYASYGEHLASWGFTAVLPSFPGSIIAPRTHAELKDDLKAVLDWVDSALTPTAIGLAGHSMGGKIALLVATEDSRPAAVFGIDPVDAAPPFSFNPADYPSVTPELMPQISVPLVLLGETVDSGGGGGFGQSCAPADDNFHQYFSHATSPALEIEVVGANHMSFLDDPNCGLPCLACTAGTDDPSTTRALTRGYMTAFFQVELNDDASFQTFLSGAEMQADEGAGLVISATANGYP